VIGCRKVISGRWCHRWSAFRHTKVRRVWKTLNRKISSRWSSKTGDCWRHHWKETLSGCIGTWCMFLCFSIYFLYKLDSGRTGYIWFWFQLTGYLAFFVSSSGSVKLETCLQACPLLMGVVFALHCICGTKSTVQIHLCSSKKCWVPTVSLFLLSVINWLTVLYFYCHLTG